jgi:Fic-DOC domain mobile mystery protein B
VEPALTPRLGAGGDPPGATPLTPEDLDGLLPSDLATRGDLDRAELENIVEARIWATGRTWTPAALLDPFAVRDLHRRMFADVWRWAGTWRRRETSIGVAPETIAVRVRDLLDDALAWVAHATYPPDEIALRLHHRLALVHPFPNGNGRHARLCADLLARSLGQPVFTWSGGDLGSADATRERYLAALRRMDADPDAVDALVAFARS